MKGKKEYMKKGVIISLSIVALLIAIVAYRFLSTKQTQTVVYAPTVETAHIENKDIVLYTSQIATVEAAESVTIYPKMAGEILTINKKLGDRVEQGEDLASIKADTLDGLKIQMDQARIAMQDAQTNYTRTKALFDAAGVSQQVLEQAASASENAKLAYTAAKTQYDIQKSYSVIKAPIAGTVEKVGIEVHNIVSPQVEAFIVTADGGLTAKFGITSDSKEVLNVGDEITIQATGGDVKAHISEISNTISATTGLYDVKAGIDEGANLSVNSKVKVSLIDKQALGVKVIPISAVNFSKEKPYIYLYKDGKAVKTEVEIGIYDSDFAELKSELGAEDEVITTWSSELYDGAEVAKKQQ